MSVRSDRIEEVYTYLANEDRDELVRELLNLLTLPCLLSLLPPERQEEFRE